MDDRATGPESTARAHHGSFASRLWQRSRRNVATFGALLFIILLLASAAFAPWLVWQDPLEQDPVASLSPPSRTHWMGTDQVGRDIFSRVVYGSRLSLAIGLSSVLLGLTAGVGIGLISGYAGGLVDEILMRGIDVLLAFPGILLAVLVAILGSSVSNVVLALAIFSIPIFARLTRGSVLAVRNLEYIHAAFVVGAPTHRVLLRHILPNVMGPIIVYATLRMASAILGGSTLSFLGVGLAPPAPEWGLMVSQGRHNIQSAPHEILFPGLAIFLTVLAFNLLGDAIRDVADPRSTSI
jgi:ABC-type dipeptide/oligopeptide/nickel transport system permease subunit